MDIHTPIKHDSLGIAGKYRFKKTNSETGELISTSDWHNNLVVFSTNHGLGLIAQALIGLNTFPLTITQLKIGKGVTAPVAANTDLQTISVSGVLRATQAFTATTATMEFFISNAQLANDTYTELGLFCGNQLFARSLISPTYTKSTNEDTSIEYIFTLANS